MNELTGFSDTKRKVVEGYLKCAILTLDHEERRERHDHYGRSIAYARRSSRATQSHTAYGQTVYRFRSDRGRSSGRWIPCEAGSPRPLHSQEHPTRSKPELINKATEWWQWTINDFVADRLFLTAWNPRRNSPRNLQPNSSISALLKFCKVCCTRAWVCTRKEVYP